MPIYEIESPDGRIIEMEGDTQPSDADIQEAFQSIGTIEQPQGQPIEQPQTPVMLDGVSGAGEQVGISPEMASAPLTSQLPQDAGMGQRLMAGATDVLTTPLSAVYAAGVTPGSGQSFWENLYNIKQGRNPFTGEQALPEQLISDPANVLIPAGSKLYQGGKKLTGMAIKSPIAQKIFGYLLGGAGEGAVSASAHQAEKVARGEDVDLGEAATETGVSAVLPGFMEGIATLAKKGLNKASRKIMESIIKPLDRDINKGFDIENIFKNKLESKKGLKTIVENIEAKSQLINEQYGEKIAQYGDVEIDMMDAWARSYENISSELTKGKHAGLSDNIEKAAEDWLDALNIPSSGSGKIDVGKTLSFRSELGQQAKFKAGQNPKELQGSARFAQEFYNQINKQLNEFTPDIRELDKIQREIKPLLPAAKKAAQRRAKNFGVSLSDAAIMGGAGTGLAYGGPESLKYTLPILAINRLQKSPGFASTLSDLSRATEKVQQIPGQPARQALRTLTFRDMVGE